MREGRRGREKRRERGKERDRDKVRDRKGERIKLKYCPSDFYAFSILSQILLEININKGFFLEKKMLRFS
jgi:hypothetical protein